MWNQPYYHKSIARVLKAVLDVFNTIDIERYYPDTQTSKLYRVPIQFGTMDVIIRKLNESVKSPPIASVFPRMSIEFDRIEVLKSNPNPLLLHYRSNNGAFTETMYAGVNIRIHYRMVIVGNKIFELLNILEQIITRFRKHINIPMYDPLGKKSDVSLTLNPDIIFNYDSEWNFGQDRTTAHELNFHTDITVYPPIETAGLIKHIDLDFYEQDSELLLSEMNWDVDPETAGELDTHTETLTKIDENGDPQIQIEETLP